MIKAPAVLAVAATLLQVQGQPPTFRARVDLVQVDVVVVDADGAPVRGLTATDFALLDRGKAQAIASFDEVSHARPRAASPLASRPIAGVAKDVSNNQSVQSGRLIVLVIDDLHIYKERTQRAKEIARKVLADLAPHSSMSVLFTSGEHSTQVTDDPARLASAVETLEGRQSWRRPNPARDDQTGARIDPEAPDPLTIVSRNQEVKVQAFFDNLTKYKTLQDAARMIGAGDARRKAFVLISEGIGKELSGIFGITAPLGRVPTPTLAPQPTESIGLLAVAAPNGYHDAALLDMMEAMRRANVATYAIDPRGRVDSKDLARECFPPPAPQNEPKTWEDPCSNGLTDWISPVRQAQHGLEIVAAASGGFAVTNTDDFTSGIGRIVDDLDHYYLLGFYPADTKGNKYRPLDVKIPGHPEWRLRFRHGYMPGGPPPPANTSEMVALAAGVLPKGDLPLRLGAVASPGSRAASRVAIVLEVSLPRRAVEEPDGRVRDTLKYEILVVDERKKKVRSVGGLEARLTLSPIDQSGPAPDFATYQVADSIDIPPGKYELRVSATSARLGSGGSVYLPVDVPDFRGMPVSLGGLVLSYAEGARVPLAPPTVAPARRAARASGPVPVAPPLLPVVPTLDREFTTGDQVRVYVEGLVRDAGHPLVTVDVIGAGGKVVASPSPSFTTRETVKVLADVPMRRLSPGPYVLRVRLASGPHEAVREVGFTVR